MKIHEKYIHRCLELAKNGFGTTYPNPMVGSVIVCDEKIIGEGWHDKAGNPHAEVNAIASVKDKSLLKRSTIYVSLEPCAHFGKTPPCSHLIVEHQIPKVIIGCVDSHSKVAGKGIQYLKENGCEVISGVLEKECLEINKRFFTYMNKNRPYVILKWAQTKDGFIDKERIVTSKEEATPNWISNTYSRQLVHQWRAEEHAILVGTNTVFNDNPTLNIRSWNGNNPIKVIIDRNLKIPTTYHVFDGAEKVIVITEIEKENTDLICYECIDFQKPIGNQILEKLAKYQIQSIIIEGGKKTLETFMEEGLWDELRVFIGITSFISGIKAPFIDVQYQQKINILEDECLIYKK